MKLKYNVVAVTGTYTDLEGNKKKNYKTVGRVLKSNKGLSLVLERTFNPAGMPGEGDIWLNFYEPKAKEEKPVDDFGDDIPF